jgi:TolB-like protein
MKGIPVKFKWISLFLLLSLILPSSSITQTEGPQKIYKVAILPFQIHSEENLDYLREGVYDILSSRITVEGRIVVIERSAVERALYEERPMRLDETVAKKIGMRVGADYTVLGSLTKIGNFISLDARLISITEGKPTISAYTQHKGIDDVMVKVGDFAQDITNKIIGRRPLAARPTERKEGWKMAPEGLDFKKSQVLNFEIRGLDIGDVDGDKKNELVVIDRHDLYIFKYDGDKMTLFQKLEAGEQNNFLTLDVADINRNGFAEIIVTNVVEDNLRSFVLEYEEGKFRKISENAPWYFRVLEHPREGPILLGQRMGSEGIFVGPIYKMVWKKKSFAKGPKMPFPKETNIFGLALADIRGMRKPELIVLDRFDRLNILAENGKTLWRSTERFGGTNIYYETKKKSDTPHRPQEGPPWRVYIYGRILIKDLDGDGIPEMIINKNELSSGKLFGNLKAYEKGAIYDLIWEKGDLTTNWRTREVKGYLVDYQVKDVDNDGEDELVVAAIGQEEGIGLLSKNPRSNIFFFKLY